MFAEPNRTPSHRPTSRRPWRVAPVVALAALIMAAGTLVCAQAPKPEAATTPEPRDGAWMDLHKTYVDRAKKGDVDLLFLGDSITQGWHGHTTVWDRYFGARRSANFGIGGDRTEHVLWRLENGEADGISPRVVVIMIGTNNLSRDTPAEIADGVTAVVGKVRQKFPKAKVLLLGVFPRSEKPDDSYRIRVQAINARIARLDDGKDVEYLDIGRHFVEPDGTISKDIMPDYLHLSRKGYRIWAESMEPKLWEMLEGSAPTNGSPGQ